MWALFWCPVSDRSDGMATLTHPVCPYVAFHASAHTPHTPRHPQRLSVELGRILPPKGSGGDSPTPD